MSFRINKIALVVILLLGGVVCGGVWGTFIALFRDLPQIRSLESYTPSAVTRIYSADNVLLAELFVEKRDPIPFEEIPDYIKKAVLATEDRNFYTHSGIDLKGILRAIVKDVVALEFVEGASTITQQLTKTLFLTPDKTLIRKLKEALLAFQLERRYTKDEILGLYLNQVYFGSGTYGIKAAAGIFFGKQVKDLTLAECALIAAMPKSPSRFSPLLNKELALKRRDLVLKQMLETRIIQKALYAEAIHEPIQIAKQSNGFQKAPYFVAYIKRFLEETVEASQLYKSGMTVHTTLSLDMQEAAEMALTNGLAELSQRMEGNGIKDPDPQAALIALDIVSGGILSMVGGKNFLESPFNRSVNAKRQPGSAFKTFIYGAAIEKGFPQNMMILDSPVAYTDESTHALWEPENFSKIYQGEMTLRKAFTLSENIPAVRLVEMLTPTSVIEFAEQLGIQSYLRPYLSLALGSSEVTLLELTSAYSIFPNMGRSIKPFGVTKIEDSNGRVIWKIKPKIKIAMSREGAAIMTNMLEGVIKEGTGQKALCIRRTIAGKTGTTNDFKDALFIGFSPSIAAGVWVGRDNFQTLGKSETGAKAALPIWIEFMTRVLEKQAYNYFDIPDDIIRVTMDPTSGYVVTEDSPEGVLAYFKKGAGPSPLSNP